MKRYAETRHIIEQGGFLSKEDMAFVDASILELQNNWEKAQMFRTETEMRISVLNDLKFPTPAAKYWQAIREQSSFYQSLVSLSFNFRRNTIKQERLQTEIDAAVNRLDKAEFQVDLEETQFQKLGLIQEARDRMRELRLWDKIMKELDNGSFDTQDVNTHQLVSYGLRFEQEIKNIANATPGEANNMVGLYRTAMRHLEAEGLLVKNDA